MGLGRLLRRLPLIPSRYASSPTLYVVDERVPDIGIGDANLVLYRDEQMADTEATIIVCRRSVTFSWDLSAVNHGAYRTVTIADRSVPIELVEPEVGDTPAPSWLTDQTFPQRPMPDDIEATVRTAMRR